MITLDTPRLRLRPFEFSDIPTLETLLSEYDVVKTTLNIPHPYPPGAAEHYITWVRDEMQRGELFSFAVTRREDALFMGSMSISLTPKHQRGEIGYWIGKPYWGNGYASEAARRIVAFGFDVLELNKIIASCFVENVASARVMQKCGMVYEGMAREHFYRWERFIDTAFYGVLRADYERLRDASTPE